MSINRIARCVLTASIACCGMAAPVRAQLSTQINVDGNGDNIPGDAANEPTLCVNPTDPNNLATGWRQFNTITSSFRLAGYAHTLDGGATWINGGVLDRPSQDSNGQMTDPVIAADRTGRFFYNSLVLGSVGNYLVDAVSSDGGATFAAWSRVTPRNSNNDKNWYAVDLSSAIGAHNHYAVWWQGGFSRSTDDGLTWESPLDVGGDQFAYATVGPSGELWVGSWSGDAVAVRQSLNAKDPGQTPTFGPARIINLGDPIWNPPVNPDGAACQLYIAVDNSGTNRQGWIYVMSSAVNGNDPADVMFSRSTDGGATFSAPLRVNDDTPGNGAYQWMAAMSVAPNGRIDIVWFDTRDNLATQDSRLYYTYSNDGGDSWAPDRPLGPAFDSRIGWPVQRKMGDYMQCQSDNGWMKLVYSATYNGEQDVWFVKARPMTLAVSPLRAGQVGNFGVSGAGANQPVFLAYSLEGLGDTLIPQLNINLSLSNPRQAGGAKRTDANGAAQWSLPIPANAAGHNLWFQAVQTEGVTNVVATQVQ